MGLFDQIAGAAINAVAGGNAAGGLGGGVAAQLVSSLLQNQAGGVQGLLQSLSSGGLGKQVQSWVGDGENEAVQPSQLSSALGGDMISQLAGKLGIPPEQVSQLLASALPALINQITPNGKVEEESTMQKGLGALLGMLK